MNIRNNHAHIKIFIIIGILFLISTCTALLGNSSTTSSVSDIQSTIITIDPISSHCVNESFNVTGTTNLPSGTELRIEVYRGSFNPGIPPQRDPWYNHLRQKTFVINDQKRGNSWVYTINTTRSYPDEYLFYAKLSNNETIQNVSIFNLDSPCINGTIPDEIVTSVPFIQNANVTTKSPSKTYPTSKPAPVSAITVVIAIGCPMIITIFKRNEKK